MTLQSSGPLVLDLTPWPGSRTSVRAAAPLTPIRQSACVSRRHQVDEASLRFAPAAGWTAALLHSPGVDRPRGWL